MRLLIVTQVVDEHDPVLGFFIAWIREFAARVESVTVICLREGVHDLPDNVQVYSLGKEHGPRSSSVYALRFLRLCVTLRNSYDSVFVHMNVEYVLLGALLWKAWGKRVTLWYMHKTVSARLQLAVFLADTVCTASPLSMRVPTRKKYVVGHGVRLEQFPQVGAPEADEPLQLLTVGRLSPVKRVEILIEAMALLRARGVAAELTIAGGSAGRRGEEYERMLHALVAERHLAGHVHFLGPVSHEAVGKLFGSAHIFVHASDTGSLDKAVLEPLFSGLPVITVDQELASEAPAGVVASRATAEGFADAVVAAQAARLYADTSIREGLRAYVVAGHSLSSLVPRLLETLSARTPLRMYARVSWRSRVKKLVMRLLLQVRDMLELAHSQEEHAILAYHAIGPAAAHTAVTAETLERHIHVALARGYVFVSLATLMRWHADGAALPGKTVTLTFDDGYADFETTTLPLLERYHIPATVFLLGDPVAARAHLANDIPLMGEEATAQLEGHPLVDLGYHSKTHANLATTATELLPEEVRPVFPSRYFAYPGGNYSDEAVSAVREAGYEAAFSIKPMLLSRTQDAFLLPRTVVTKDTEPWMVAFALSRAASWYRYMQLAVRRHLSS